MLSWYEQINGLKRTTAYFGECQSSTNQFMKMSIFFLGFGVLSPRSKSPHANCQHGD